MTNKKTLEIINQIKQAIANDYYIDKQMQRDFAELVQEVELLKIMIENHSNKEK